VSHGCRFDGISQLYLWFWGAGGVRYNRLPSNFLSGEVPDGWHHVAATTSNHVRSLYIDGELVGQATHSGTPNIPAENFMLGHDPSQANSRFKGYMDEVMIFDKALSADEIRAAMQGIVLDAPAGGMAAATASGTSFEVTDGQVAFCGLAATGGVSVATAAEALFAGGANILAGSLAGTGTLAVTNGATLSLAGGQDFGGTLEVRDGGTLALVPGAGARVRALHMAEGIGFSLLPVGSGVAALVVTEAVVLPTALTIRVDVPETAEGFKETLLESATGLSGDVSGWTLDAQLPSRGSWKAIVKKNGDKVVISAHPGGACIIFR